MPVTAATAPPPAAAAGRLGDRLVASGLITADQLDIAMAEKARSRKMLGTLLVDFGFITADALSAVLSESLGLVRYDAKSTVIDAQAARLLPKEVARTCRSILLAVGESDAEVAMVDPYDVMAQDQLRRHLPKGVALTPRLCTEAELAEALDRIYGYESSVDGIVKELQTGRATASAPGSEDGHAHPIIRLVDTLILEAVNSGASDLHFEPENQFVRLRCRVDGRLEQVRTFQAEHWPAMSHRLKIMAGMNIADKLSAQDGRFSLRLGSRDVDFRVASLPTIHGENIVLRVLDKTSALKSLDDLGFSAHNRNLIEIALARPEGIIVVTGPTGSGKTTTLYAVLQKISNVGVNVMTLEDPVEYQVPLIRQTQVREQSGLTFAEGIRSLMRQDPDIIFVGEVRDNDTAQMALRAAMTGHQVFTTLHTNDAAGVFPRLFDLGLKPGMVAGNVVAVLAQRLVRTLCRRCRRPRPATAAERHILGADAVAGVMLHDPVGCEHCRGGYRGRVAVAEVMVLDERLDAAVSRGAERGELRALMAAQGHRSMLDDGIVKVLGGDTTLAALAEAVDLSSRLRV